MVPTTCPAATVCPTATATDAIFPETANDAVASRTGEMEPVVVMVLLTTPCCTVPVSCTRPESAVLATEVVPNGCSSSTPPTRAPTTTAARTPLITRGREILMS